MYSIVVWCEINDEFVVESLDIFENISPEKLSTRTKLFLATT